MVIRFTLYVKTQKKPRHLSRRNLERTIMHEYKDTIISFPLFPLSSRFDETPIICDINDEPTNMLMIRERVDVEVEALEGYANVHDWVKAMSEKYNVINLNDYARI